MNLRSRIGCGLIVGLTLVFTSLAPAPEDSAKEKRNALAARRIVLRKNILAITQQRVNAGEADVTTLCEASRRLIEAYREGGTTRKETLVAAQDHLALLKKVELFEKERFEQKAITLCQFEEVKDAVLEAEIWLIDAEAK